MSMQVKDSQKVVDFNEEKIKLIKNTIAKNCTDSELDLFIHSCQRLGLDPIMKQIYAVKRGNVMTIQTGIDGYRLIAERTGKYMPGKEATYVYDNKRLVSATAYVKKLGPDNQWHEVAATAFFSEYNAAQGLWNKMPHVMLAKCAESAALRRAFPAEMSGIYTEEEMSQANVHNTAISHDQKVVEETVTHQVIDVKESAEERSDLATPAQVNYILGLLKKSEPVAADAILDTYGIKCIQEATKSQANEIIGKLQSQPPK
jgi:phage recombination protein Bet